VTGGRRVRIHLVAPEDQKIRVVAEKKFSHRSEKGRGRSTENCSQGAGGRRKDSRAWKGSRFEFCLDRAVERPIRNLLTAGREVHLRQEGKASKSTLDHRRGGGSSKAGGHRLNKARRRKKPLALGEGDKGEEGSFFPLGRDSRERLGGGVGGSRKKKGRYWE